MRKLMQSLSFLVVMIGGTILFSMESEAKVIVVKDADELNEELGNITEDVTIKLDPNFEVSENKPFSVYDYTSYKVTIDCNNVNTLYGGRILKSGTGDLIIKNYRNVGSQNVSVPSGGTEIHQLHEKGRLIIKDSIIGEKNLSDAFFLINANKGEVEFNNVTFRNIDLKHSAVLEMTGGILHLKVNNSLFENNFSESGAPAIYNKSGYGELEINNSIFRNNVSRNKRKEYVASGAIATEETKKSAKTIIKDSYFENNRIEDNQNTDKFAAGAINIKGDEFAENIQITGTTFNNNEGANGGGAISIIEKKPSETLMTLENNTFYKNKSTAYDKKFINGGAVLLYTEEQGKEIIETELNSKNNTYYGNQLIRSDEVDADVQGAAVGVENTYVTHELSNSLYVGNELVNNKQASKNFENIYVSNEKFLQSHNLGFDNGEASKDTVKDAYGKYPVVMGDNGGKVKVGGKEDAINIPTIMIAPKLTNSKGTIYAGLANMTGSDATEKDQRGYTRKGKPDIGAVEISSIVYDSNGGKFNLPELKEYDGKTYYEGANADQYAKVGAPDVAFTIIDGKKVLKPTKANYDFIGWTDKKTDKFVKAKYNTGKKVMVDDQTVLYAVWKKKTYSLKYFNNGKTTGTIPTQKNVTHGSSITIKSAGKLKRKGYKFSGWSTKPSAKKGEAAYAPGKKLKLVKNTKLYAIWKR